VPPAIFTAGVMAQCAAGRTVGLRDHQHDVVLRRKRLE